MIYWTLLWYNSFNLILLRFFKETFKTINFELLCRLSLKYYTEFNIHYREKFLTQIFLKLKPRFVQWLIVMPTCLFQQTWIFDIILFFVIYHWLILMWLSICNNQHVTLLLITYYLITQCLYTHRYTHVH